MPFIERLIPREWISPIAIQHTVETHGDIFHHQSTQQQQQDNQQQNKQQQQQQKEKNHIV